MGSVTTLISVIVGYIFGKPWLDRQIAQRMKDSANRTPTTTH